MRKTVLTLALALAAGTAQAQIKCWNDANGKRVCGDNPPPGVKGTAIRGTQSAPAAPAASKDAKKGRPLTPAEQEQEFRKRQAEAQKASAKAEAEQKEKALKSQNCEQAKESLRMLESGQRIARTDAKGERYYLDERQVAQEAAKAREVAQRACD
jgi:hypothetical protein